MAGDEHRLRTYKERISNDGELAWGGTDGWEGKLDLIENVEHDGGALRPGTPVAGTIEYNFSTGDLSEWDNINGPFQVDSSVTYGLNSYSGFCPPNSSGGTEHRATEVPDGYVGGQQISSFEYYWRETGSSFGGGIRLYNSQGNVEIGTMSNNPQWMVDDANGKSYIYGGDGYQNWTRFSLTFDWQAGTVDIDFEDMETGTRETDTRALKHGVDVEMFEVMAYTGSGWGGGDGVMEMWFSDITLEL